MKPLVATLLLLAATAAGAKPPNVVLIVADDLGAGDLGCTGSKTIRTPALDKLASQGVRFSHYRAAQAVCTASRAAILTGCYPNRIGLSGALGPKSATGLAPAETTLAELLRSRGYATAAVGKWHLGTRAEFLPTNQGFGQYFGIPYSHDMWPGHPTAGASYPPLRLMDNARWLEPPLTDATQSTLTDQYTGRAVQFVREHAGRPFFLYLAHNAPHVPLFPAAGTKGQSPGGAYGDVVEEIDRSTGAVLAALDQAGVADDTLVVFTSDNGPWLAYGDHAGGTGGLRAGKMTVFEGGVRVPCIARLPGVLPAGRVQDQPWMAIDLLPTIATLAGAPLPARKIDGVDVLPVWKCAPGAASPQPGYALYYANNELRAVTRGRWKLVFAHQSQTLADAPGVGGKPGAMRQERVPEALYDLVADPAESLDAAGANPAVVSELRQYAEAVRAELGDKLTGREGVGTRPAGESPPLGTLSEKYESGGRGPGTVSTGVGDPGGVSYGTYQLSSKVGQAGKFVEKCYPAEFKGLEPGSPAFTARWVALAKADPVALHAAEHDYIHATHYAPQARRLRAELKLDPMSRSRALRDVVWSTAVQHGGNTDVITSAVRPLIKGGQLPGDRAIIEAVYAERGRTKPDGTLARFRGVSADWIPALKSRFTAELADALALLTAER